MDIKHTNVRQKVIIVGSGLAGLSAAYELTKTGQYDITVLEKEKTFGGRTSNWNDKGMEIESGFHKFIGFYTHLPALIKGVGLDLDQILQWEDQIEYRTTDKKRALYSVSILRRPLQTILSVVGNFHYLTIVDRLQLIPLFTIGLWDYFVNPKKLDSVDLYTYARKLGAGEGVILKLLEPLSTGIFFLPVREYSAFMFFSLFGAYLPILYKFCAGAFKGGMTEVMIQPIINWLRAHGVTVENDREVLGLLGDKNKIHGVVTSHGEYKADYVILAAPIKPAQELLQKTFPNEGWVKNMLELKTLAAVTLQIELTEPMLNSDHAVFAPGTIISSFSEESHTAFPKSKGRLSLILTPPDDLIKLSDEELLKYATADLKRIGIDIEGKILDYRTTRFKHDFYRFEPGAEEKRPTQKTPVEGLVLAGDYTKQKYMTTMEGAVYSGKLAAGIIRKV